MFEKKLQQKFEKIFGLEKVTYDSPSESQEQEGVFIQVTDAKCRVKDKLFTAHVTGVLHVFANREKLPYGFFSKCIDAASAEDTKGLFFYEFEENKGTFRNIAQRSVSFKYFYDGQYDPDVGTLNQLNLTISET